MENLIDEKFDMDSIEKTFVNYKAKQIIMGKVIALREDGAVFNVGGKSDAFIPVAEYPDFKNAKIGNEFSVMLEGVKTDEGMVLASKLKADGIIIGNKDAENIKLGSKFTFVVSNVYNNNLLGKIGEFEIIVPNDEISEQPQRFLGKYLNKQIEVVALEISNKRIIASITALEKQKQQILENTFWPSLFINKKVVGRVVKIMPYGAFVNVMGVDCFVHISNLSYNKISSPEEVIAEGQELEFRIVSFDKETKKIALGLKQNFENPVISKLKELQIGCNYNGNVVKILPFGAIIRLENQTEGLLHVSDVANVSGKRIYEVVKLDDNISVMVKDVDLERKRVSFIYNPSKELI